MYREYIPEGRRIWNYVRANQVPTILSLLTPEYRERLVQQLYHEGVNAAHQWNASYCRPEGFMRQWATGPTPNHMVVTPDVVLLLGSSSDNVSRTVRIGREFPLGTDVPQWYGDTIGFWDGDALIAWTANVQAWSQHTNWEFSYELEASNGSAGTEHGSAGTEHGSGGKEHGSRRLDPFGGAAGRCGTSPSFLFHV